MKRILLLCAIVSTAIESVTINNESLNKLETMEKASIVNSHVGLLSTMGKADAKNAKIQTLNATGKVDISQQSRITNATIEGSLNATNADIENATVQGKAYVDASNITDIHSKGRLTAKNSQLQKCNTSGYLYVNQCCKGSRYTICNHTADIYNTDVETIEWKIPSPRIISNSNSGVNFTVNNGCNISQNVVIGDQVNVNNQTITGTIFNNSGCFGNTGNSAIISNPSNSFNEPQPSLTVDNSNVSYINIDAQKTSHVYINNPQKYAIVTFLKQPGEIHSNAPEYIQKRMRN